MPDPKFQPRHFYLNERHELLPEKDGGGGRQQPFLDVDWQRKSENLARSFEKIERRAAASSDPSTKGRLYILAERTEKITVKSEAQDAVGGRKVKEVSFAGEHSKVFERLGLALIDVHPNGTATVHALPEQIARMRADIIGLPQGNRRQHGQWISIESFDWVPAELKYDSFWLDEIGKRRVEAHIKLQPFLPTFDADAVIRAIERTLTRFPGNELRGKEVGYLGRIWLRAVLSDAGVRALAEEFAAIQSIHAPILAELSGPEVETVTLGMLELPQQAGSSSALPCVCVVDTAIPDEHRILAQFRRGPFLAKGCENSSNDHHGSSVASRVVFGDLDFGDSVTGVPPATCSFYEIRAADKDSGRIRAESVAGAMSNVTGNAPDVRVFNLSFDTKQSLEALEASTPSYYREVKKVMEDFDNFAFDEDALLVIAAGNVEPGNIPQPKYPKHLTDKRWQLHAWPRCFNALTCGGTIARISSAGLGDVPNAPSPFTRLGPGSARSPKPDFCAPAGNTNADYSPERGGGLGIWAISAFSEPLEVFGTSHAAPLLAREAAFVLHELRRVCPPDVRPYVCTAKALLALTAEDVSARLPSDYHAISPHALGYGRASAEPLRHPDAAAALFFWQGFAERAGDVVRVQIPIPMGWLNAAAKPELRICISWDSPVNSAVDSWACRDVTLTLRVTDDSDPANGTRRKSVGYPLYCKSWNLKEVAEKTPPPDDSWVVEMAYEQIAAYAAGHFPTPIQRIAFAAELKDADEAAVSPQAFVQNLPVAATMNRFSVAAVPLRQPLGVTSGI